MGPPERNRLTIVPPPPSIPPVRGERGLGVAPASVGFLEVVESWCRLRVLEAWAELRLLVCEDARLESIAARGVAGPDATIEAMRFAASGDGFTVRDFEIEALETDVVLVRASTSHSERDVSVLTSVQWLVSGRDGLIWRARIVASRAEAELVLRDEGHALGV
jgi:hypothetical protein